MVRASPEDENACTARAAAAVASARARLKSVPVAVGVGGGRVGSDDPEEGREHAGFEELLEQGVVRLEQAEGGERAHLVLQPDVLHDDVDEPEELLAAVRGGERGSRSLRGDREPRDIDRGGAHARRVPAPEVHGEPDEMGASRVSGEVSGAFDARAGAAPRPARLHPRAAAALWENGFRGLSAGARARGSHPVSVSCEKSVGVCPVAAGDPRPDADRPVRMGPRLVIAAPSTSPLHVCERAPSRRQIPFQLSLAKMSFLSASHPSR